MTRGLGPKTYRLATSAKLFLAAFVVFFPVVVVLMFASILRRESPPQFSWIFFLWLAYAVFAVSRSAVRGVVRIDLNGGTLRLRAPLRTIEVPVGDVVSVETSWWDVNRFAPLIRYRHGTARLLGPFDGFYDFLARLREMNPAVEVKRL